MWSVYVFISFLCFKPQLGYPQPDLGNLGSQISESVRQELAPLADLGTNIKNEVEESLLPVRAMSIKNDMANGIGGTTVATFDGKTPRTFIVNNGARSICKGTIKGSQCDGTVEPFTITVREDYCYSTSHAVVNNDICLSSRSVHLTFRNNKFECTSGDGTPTLVLTRQEFQDLCSDVTSRHIVYKYYANSNDPKAIPIPNSNQHVKCLNNEPGVCEFEEHKPIAAGGSITSNESDNFSSRNNVTSADRSGTNTSGCSLLFQQMGIILFAVTISFLFQY